MNRDSVRLPCRDKHLLFHRVLPNIVIIDSDAYFSFMHAAAHITAYRKYCISFFIHFKQFDPVIRAHITYVRILDIGETKYQRSLIRLLIIIP